MNKYYYRYTTGEFFKGNVPKDKEWGVYHQGYIHITRPALLFLIIKTFFKRWITQLD